MQNNRQINISHHPKEISLVEYVKWSQKIAVNISICQQTLTARHNEWWIVGLKHVTQSYKLSFSSSIWVTDGLVWKWVFKVKLTIKRDKSGILEFEKNNIFATTDVFQKFHPIFRQAGIRPYMVRWHVGQVEFRVAVPQIPECVLGEARRRQCRVSNKAGIFALFRHVC